MGSAIPRAELQTRPEQTGPSGNSHIRWDGKVQRDARLQASASAQQFRCYCKQIGQEMKSSQVAPAAAAFSARKAGTTAGKNRVADVETAGAQAKHQPACKRGDLLLISRSEA